MHYQNRHRRQGFWHFWQRLVHKLIHSPVWQRAIALLLAGLCLFALAACEPIP